MTAHAVLLPDGRRLHLQHGPIDLVVEAWGAAEEVRAAYRQARDAFDAVLSGLVAELPLLRAALGARPPRLEGPVARRMLEACWPFRAGFITPMAAVAGAVADHMLAALKDGRRLAKAYVNDGGDIAFHLAPGERLECGMVADLGRSAAKGGLVPRDAVAGAAPAAPVLAGRIALASAMPVRGIATSGAPTKGSGGRSFSFGIADAVTVLAVNAAAADAAATVIANAVDLPGHDAIRRAPASALDPDSDLGERLVTVEVPPLSQGGIATALDAGLRVAEALRRKHLIHGAVLALQGELRLCGAETRRRLAA